MVTESPNSECKEILQPFAGLNTFVEMPEEFVGTDTMTPTTQDYVQAYHEALDGYRRRFVVLERYSALLNR